MSSPKRLLMAWSCAHSPTHAHRYTQTQATPTQPSQTLGRESEGGREGARERDKRRKGGGVERREGEREKQREGGRERGSERERGKSREREGVKKGAGGREGEREKQRDEGGKRARKERREYGILLPQKRVHGLSDLGKGALPEPGLARTDRRLEHDALGVGGRVHGRCSLADAHALEPEVVDGPVEQRCPNARHP